MQQQAAMAAQAVAETIPMGQNMDSKVEQVRLQQANLLMMLTLNIPEFEGASSLPDFLDNGGALIDQLNSGSRKPSDGQGHWPAPNWYCGNQYPETSRGNNEYTVGRSGKEAE